MQHSPTTILQKEPLDSTDEGKKVKGRQSVKFRDEKVVEENGPSASSSDEGEEKLSLMSKEGSPDISLPASPEETLPSPTGIPTAMDASRESVSSSLANTFTSRSSYRTSWIPEWMGSFAWVDKIQVPLDEYEYVFDNDDDGAILNEEEEGEDCDSGVDEYENLVVLFTNLAKAVTQATPWTSEVLSKETRRMMMESIVRKFLDRSLNAVVMGRYIKQVLLGIRRENNVEAMQFLYVAFMHEVAWKGYDTFRDSNNFYLDSTRAAFAADCTEKVEKRLHEINEAVSQAEARVSNAIHHWNDIHTSAKCFGNFITIQLEQLEFLSENRIVGNNTHKVPTNLQATVTFRVNGFAKHRVFVRGLAKRSDEDPNVCMWSKGGKSATLAIGEEGEFRAEQSEIIVDIQTRSMCGLFGSEPVTSITIPLVTLYDSIASFDSKSRMVPNPPGAHFCSNLYCDRYREYGLQAKLHMACLCEEHRETPPFIDVVKEQERRKKALENVSDDDWMVDHHAAVKELVEIFGELDDGSNYALQLYCDRYLIHDEHYKIALLISVGLKGSFADEETRQSMVAAVQSLIQERPHVLTKSSANWIDEAIVQIRNLTIDRIVALEDVTDDPLDAADIFACCRALLELTGITASDIPFYVERRALEEGAVIKRKLYKLVHLLPGEDGQPHPSLSARMSMLLELEQRGDKKLLVGKARVLLEIVENFLFQLDNSLNFAEDSKCQAVMAITLRRTDLLLGEIIPAFGAVQNAFFGELAKQLEPDPLGDTFGILCLVYERVMNVVDHLSDNEAMMDICQKVFEMFTGFMPCWFSMCEIKICVPGRRGGDPSSYSWVDTILRTNKLEAITPGRVFCNCAPADARDLLEALFELFNKLMKWCEPEMAASNCTSFAKIIGFFAEVFAEHLRSQGRASQSLNEQVVCASTMYQFQKTMNTFWIDHFVDEILPEYDDGEGILAAKFKTIKAQYTALMEEEFDKVVCEVGKGMKKWSKGIFGGIPLAGSEQECKEYLVLLKQSLWHELRHIKNETWEPVAKDLLLECTKNVYSTFSEFVLDRNASHLQERVASTCTSCLGIIEDGVEYFAGGIVSSSELFEHSAKMRSFLRLASEPSSGLIASLTNPRGGLNEREQSRMMAVLQRRTDKEAQRFVKTCK